VLFRNDARGFLPPQVCERPFFADLPQLVLRAARQVLLILTE